MVVKNEGFPDLERYLEERGRHLVTYTEGALSEIFNYPRRILKSTDMKGFQRYFLG